MQRQRKRKADSPDKDELSEKYPECFPFVGGRPVGCSVSTGDGGYRHNFCVDSKNPKYDCKELWPDKYQANVDDKANGGDGRVEICLHVHTSLGLCKYILDVLNSRDKIKGWNSAKIR